MVALNKRRVCRRHMQKKRAELKLHKCKACNGWWKEAVNQIRVKRTIEYARSQGHGVAGCDMYHPGCVACLMVDILEGER